MKELTPLIIALVFYACSSGSDGKRQNVDTIASSPVVQQSDPVEGMDISSAAVAGSPVDAASVNDFLSHMLYSMRKGGFMTDSPSVISAKLLETEVHLRGVPENYSPVYTQSKIGRYNAWLAVLEWYFLKTAATDNTSLNETEYYTTLENVAGIAMFQEREEKRPFNYVNPGFIDWCWQNFYRRPISGQGVGGASFASLYDVSFKKLVRTLVVAHEETATKGFDNESVWYQQEIIGSDQYASSVLPLRYTAPAAQSEEIDVQYFPFASGFWVRRHIDGTENKIWKYLREVVMDYDYDWGCNYFKICDRG